MYHDQNVNVVAREPAYASPVGLEDFKKEKQTNVEPEMQSTKSKASVGKYLVRKSQPCILPYPNPTSCTS